MSSQQVDYDNQLLLYQKMLTSHGRVSNGTKRKSVFQNNGLVSFILKLSDLSSKKDKQARRMSKPSNGATSRGVGFDLFIIEKKKHF